MVLRARHGGDVPLYDGVRFIGFPGRHRAAGSSPVEAEGRHSRSMGYPWLQPGGFHFRPDPGCCHSKTRALPGRTVFDLWGSAAGQSGLALHESAGLAVGHLSAAGNHGRQILPVGLQRPPGGGIGSNPWLLGFPAGRGPGLWPRALGQQQPIHGHPLHLLRRESGQFVHSGREYRISPAVTAVGGSAGDGLGRWFVFGNVADFLGDDGRWPGGKLHAIQQADGPD